MTGITGLHAVTASDLRTAAENSLKLTGLGLEWATFQVMRRTFATLSKKAGVDAHTRAAQVGNTVDVNENEYAVASFDEKLAAVRKLESAVAPAAAQEELKEEND